jgi:hypothetical protein
MLNISIQNFKRIAKAELALDKALNIFIGPNEAGKTSFRQALEYAFTGAAAGLKGKASEGLRSNGSRHAMSVAVSVDALTVRRGEGSGTPISSVATSLGLQAADILPLLFNSEFCGDGGNKQLKSFLNSVAEVSLDPVQVLSSPDLKHCLDQARLAGIHAAKPMVAYFEQQRAACKAPPVPVRPAGAPPEPETIASLNAELQALGVQVSGVASRLNDLLARRDIMAETLRYYKTLEDWTVASLAASLAGGDALGPERRSALRTLGAISTTPLAQYENIVTAAGFDASAVRAAAVALKSALENVQQQTTQLLSSHPVPPSVGSQPVANARVVSVQSEFPSAEAVSQHLVQLEAEIGMVRAQAAELQQQYNSVKARTSEAERLVGAWEAYRAAESTHATAEVAAKVAWNQWDLAAKTLKEAELQLLQESGGAFSKVVDRFAAPILHGRTLDIDVQRGIFLGGTPIEQCSGSTRWRIEVVIMASIAAFLKSPILLIDGADILDVDNRAVLTDFLLREVVPCFRHVLLLSTCQGRIEDEKPLPPAISNIAAKFSINAGVIAPL